MPLTEACSINRIVMRNHFLEGAAKLVLEQQIVSPQEAAVTSTVHHGSH